MSDQPPWMDRVTCPGCGRTPTAQAIANAACPRCSAALTFEPDPAGVADDHLGGPWRYRALLPCDYRAQLDPGSDIRVIPSPPLAQALGVGSVTLVDCTTLGTGTFKDLEAQVWLAAAADLGQSPLWIHSTGNTARAYHEWARRIDTRCAVSVPARHLHKLAGCRATERQPIVTIDASPAKAADRARELAGAWHARSPGASWKLEGAATVGYTLAERCGQAQLIVQTIGSGFGPLGYELGLRRAARIDAFASSPIVRDHSFMLFQPSDAAIVARVFDDTTGDLPDVAALPTEPFEPTLQSTNGPATIGQLRRLPGAAVSPVDPIRVLYHRSLIDDILGQAAVRLDFDREKSTHIAIAGLLERRWDPGVHIAVIVTGAAPFGRGVADESLEVIGAIADAVPAV